MLKMLFKKGLNEIGDETKRASNTKRRDLIYMILKDISKDCHQLSVSRLCSDLNVSRSGYYEWMEGNQMLYPDIQKMKIKNEIEDIAVDFPKYGHRRVKIELVRGYQFISAFERRRVLDTPELKKALPEKPQISSILEVGHLI